MEMVSYYLPYDPDNDPFASGLFRATDTVQASVPERFIPSTPARIVKKARIAEGKSEGNVYTGEFFTEKQKRLQSQGSSERNAMAKCKTPGFLSQDDSGVGESVRYSRNRIYFLKTLADSLIQIASSKYKASDRAISEPVSSTCNKLGSPGRPKRNNAELSFDQNRTTMALMLDKVDICRPGRASFDSISLAVCPYEEALQAFSTSTLKPALKASQIMQPQKAHGRNARKSVDSTSLAICPYEQAAQAFSHVVEEAEDKTNQNFESTNDQLHSRNSVDSVSMAICPYEHAALLAGRSSREPVAEATNHEETTRTPQKEHETRPRHSDSSVSAAISPYQHVVERLVSQSNLAQEDRDSFSDSDEVFEPPQLHKYKLTFGDDVRKQFDVESLTHPQKIPESSQDYPLLPTPGRKRESSALTTFSAPSISNRVSCCHSSGTLLSTTYSSSLWTSISSLSISDNDDVFKEGVLDDVIKQDIQTEWRRLQEVLRNIDSTILRHVLCDRLNTFDYSRVLAMSLLLPQKEFPLKSCCSHQGKVHGNEGASSEVTAESMVSAVADRSGLAGPCKFSCTHAGGDAGKGCKLDARKAVQQLKGCEGENKEASQERKDGDKRDSPISGYVETYV